MMQAQATAKFSVLTTETIVPCSPRDECVPPNSPATKPFITDTSRGNPMDVAERTVEIALRYGDPSITQQEKEDTAMTDSQHSSVPFLGDIVQSQDSQDMQTNAKTNDAAPVDLKRAAAAVMDDTQTKESLLNRLIAVWSDDSLSSLPLEHGIFDQDEAFWKAFVMGISPDASRWPCVNALYQIERRFPHLYETWRTHEIASHTLRQPLQTTDEPSKQDSVGKETVTEDPKIAEEPAAKEPVAKEPAAEDPSPIETAQEVPASKVDSAEPAPGAEMPSPQEEVAPKVSARVEPVKSPRRAPAVQQVVAATNCETREPLTETDTANRYATERALAELWMNTNLNSLPIQNVSGLDMGIFLDALSASRMSITALQAMNGLYGLERIQSSRYNALLRQVQHHSSTAIRATSSKAAASMVPKVTKKETSTDALPGDKMDVTTPESDTSCTLETVPKDIATSATKVDDTVPHDNTKAETTTTDRSLALPNESTPEHESDVKAEECTSPDASFATSETAMSSMIDPRGTDDAIPTSSTSSLKSIDSSVDVVPLKVAGNPTMTAPSYSEIIRKAATEQVPFQERAPTVTRNTAPVKQSQPKSRFVPSLSAVVSANDSKPLTAPKDQELFDRTSIVVLMTSNPAHPEIARQQTIVENTLKEEGCGNYMILDGADRVHKWKRNSLFDLSGSHGEYPQIFNRDLSGKLSFWGTFANFMKAKNRGTLLDELANKITAAVEEPVDKTLLVLVSGQSLKHDVKVKQTKAISILDALKIPYETLDGADSVNKDRRTQLFALSGNPGQYPQFFTVGPNQEVSHWGGWDDFESSNELGSLAKEFHVTAPNQTDRAECASPASVPTTDGSLVCLISGQSIERNVRSQQEKSFAIFKDQSIPYETIDGADKSNKSLRKKLFGISGLGAVYPQFFLKKKDEYAFLGRWEKLEECNDNNTMGLFLTPVPVEPKATNDVEVSNDGKKSSDNAPQATSSSSVKRSLSTQPTPKMENLSHGTKDAIATSNKETEASKSSNSKSEITFYGATSFVAKHALDYMIQVSLTLPGVRSITLAGRNADKVENLRKTVTDKMNNMRTLHPDGLGRCVFDVFVADSSDFAGLEIMASRTKVVASFAGPFAKYSEKVVAACAKVGTDYVDITGEVSWASAMRLKYSSLAEASGARIISFCGFDSVPSDLAIYAAAENMKRKLGRSTEIASGTTWHYAQGSANGGTIQTVVDMPLNISKCFFRWVPFLVDDPLALTHPTVRLDSNNAQRKDRLATAEWMNQLLTFESFLGMGVSAPFFMAPVNAKVVHASSVALDYGPDFVYRERFLPLGFRMTKAMSILTFIPAACVQLGVLFLAFVLKFPVFGKILSNIFFPAGSGMADQFCRKGISEVYAEVVTPEKNGKVDRVYCAMKFEGDPGNWVTAQCICESTLALLLDRSKLPKRSSDGFGTPAELLGSVLLERLEKTKVRPVDVKTYVQKGAVPGERVLCHFQ